MANKMNNMFGFGLRKDGSSKGLGFFGELKRPDGGISTELSIGIGTDKGELEIPLLVPGLTKQEISVLLSGGKPSKDVVNKAISHAKQRMFNGLSPFANEKEYGKYKPIDINN